MAYRIDLSFLISIISILTPNLEKSFVWRNNDSQHTYTVELSSMLPSSTCDPSYTVQDHEYSSMKVINKYGPCSHHNHENLNSTDLNQKFLRQDKLRAQRIYSRLFTNKPLLISAANRRFQQKLSAASLPVKPSDLLGGGGAYYVTIGLGTPKKNLSLLIDSGSDITWTQCKPCPLLDCYTQLEPMFDPSTSSSYSNEDCESEFCTYASVTQQPTCSGSTCTYRVDYEDNAYSEGYLARDTLTLSSSDVISNYAFGCGHKNDGSDGIAGMMGLGRGKISIVDQTASKYNRLFASCLPSNTSTSGYLKFGNSSSKAVYTPMIKFTPVAAQSLYGVKLLTITLGGVNISVPDTSSTIVDSGGTLTTLPPTLYSQLRTEFRNQMKSYIMAPASGDMDTCYYIIGKVKIPKMSFTFDGGAVVDLLPGNIMIRDDILDRMCLAFYGYLDNVTILGNVMQKGFEVVHDINNAKIGFVPNSC